MGAWNIIVASLESFRVSGRMPDPSAFITKMSVNAPRRIETNAIREPSGDHAGSQLLSVSVNSRWPEPSGFMTTICLFPPLLWHKRSASVLGPDWASATLSGAVQVRETG